MTIRRLTLAAALFLSACASGPVAGPADKPALAREVFELSGGLGELKLAARYAVPLALNEAGDLGARCREGLGKDAPAFAKAACDMVEAALGDVKGEGRGLARALDAELGRLEARAAEAMAETYSVEELQAMRRYYASPEGRSIVEKRAQYWAALAGSGR
jgi:hypothetical protein